MSGASIANQLCVYFGGPYVAGQHSYRTPQITVPNMDPVVRRATPKRDDHQGDYFAAPNPGVPIGCLIFIHLARGREKRIAVAGATSGVKHVTWNAGLHCFLRCESSYVEDAQDAEYALLDAIRAHIEADRTCGSGGFEAGYGVGFQAGEGDSTGIEWDLSPVVTTPRDLSKAYVSVTFAVSELIQA